MLIRRKYCILSSWSWKQCKNSIHATFIQYSTSGLSHCGKANKEINGINIGKEEVKSSLFDMMASLENVKESTRQLSELKSNLAKLQGIRLI